MRTVPRAIAAGVALACLATLIIAARLTPNPTGMGTHQGMGFMPCGFLERTHLPCPSCGMTTSYAFFIRGQWLASLYVQPMGFILALLTAVTFWIALYEALTGKPIHRLVALLPISYHLIPVMALVVIAWAWKIYIHIRQIDGWGS